MLQDKPSSQFKGVLPGPEMTAGAAARGRPATRSRGKAAAERGFACTTLLLPGGAGDGRGCFQTSRVPLAPLQRRSATRTANGSAASAPPRIRTAATPADGPAEERRARRAGTARPRDRSSPSDVSVSQKLYLRSHLRLPPQCTSSSQLSAALPVQVV